MNLQKLFIFIFICCITPKSIYAQKLWIGQMSQAGLPVAFSNTLIANPTSSIYLGAGFEYQLKKKTQYTQSIRALNVDVHISMISGSIRRNDHFRKLDGVLSVRYTTIYDAAQSKDVYYKQGVGLRFTDPLQAINTLAYYDPAKKNIGLDTDLSIGVYLKPKMRAEMGIFTSIDVLSFGKSNDFPRLNVAQIGIKFVVYSPLVGIKQAKAYREEIKKNKF